MYHVTFITGFLMKKFFVLSISLFLFGCSPLLNDVSAEYANTARQLGLVAVYPPREEFQIGDMFAVSFGEEPNDSVRVWIGEAEGVSEIAEEFMKSRIVFRATGEEGSAVTSSLKQADTFGQTLARRSDVRIETLPVSAFPEITADSGLTAGLGIAKALQAIGLGGGVGTKVTLNFGDVRTYWAPKIKIASKVNIDSAYGRVFTPNETTIREALDRELALAKLSGRNISTTRCLGGVVITRVYLTRKITYTYSNGKIIAAGIRIASEGSELTNIPAPTRITVDVKNTNGQIEQDTPNEELAKLREQIDEVAASGAQGKGLNFESWSALGVTFSQTFPRPVAIGYDAFSIPFKIDGEPKCLIDLVPKIHSLQ